MSIKIEACSSTSIEVQQQENLLNAPKELRDALECSICANILEDPKQLACGHTYCEPCITRLIVHKATWNSSVKTVCCPQCRAVSAIPEDGLKTNYIVKDMITTLKGLEIKESKNKVKCCYCEREVKNDELFFCKTCQKNGNVESSLMCGVCTFKLHKEHDINFCEDFATQEVREKYSNLVKSEANIIEALNCKLDEMHKTVQFDVAKLFTLISSKMVEHSKNFDELQLECLMSNKTMTNSDLEQNLAKAKLLKNRLEKVVVKTQDLKTQMIDNMNNFYNEIETILNTTSDNTDYSFSSELDTTTNSIHGTSFASQTSISSQNVFTLTDFERKPIKTPRRKKIHRPQQ